MLVAVAKPTNIEHANHFTERAVADMKFQTSFFPSRLTDGLRLFCLLWTLSGPSFACALQIHAELNTLSIDEIAQDAVRMGVARRGALVFHSIQLGCARCHSGGTQNNVGPDLATYPAGKQPSDVAIVESILFPSRVIRESYENQTWLTVDGRTLSGRLLTSNNNTLQIQDATGKVTTIPRDEIEATKVNPLSSMPEGLLEQIGSRQQLLDLVRYLIEIRDHGPNRAKELQPSAALLANPLPEYESRVDHAALIACVNEDVLKQGEAIYQRVCANCHGTVTDPGSLPNSLRFAEGKFKNGGDPYSMYATLTHGWGMMTPQTWMVPQQKYAVIHYIRERYLREHNPSQWAEITEAYLKTLPAGDSLGPEPSQIEPWSSMDYGTSLTHTYQISDEPLNIAYKGIAVRLDFGEGGIARGNQWAVFDTDTLRWAAGWEATGTNHRFIDWRGIQFNGEHQIHPRAVGNVVFGNSNGPGWANPSNHSFADQDRLLGLDQRRYGPLPKSWGKFLGQYHYGQSVVMAYRVGEALIYESPGMRPAVAQEHGTVFTRNMWIGPRSHDLLLRVADLTVAKNPLRCGLISPAETCEWLELDNQVILKLKAGSEPLKVLIGVASDSRESQKRPESFSRDLDLHGARLLPYDQDWLHGDVAHWGQTIETFSHTVGDPQAALAVDYLNVPDANPWLAQMRLTGLDFFDDGRIAVCTWDGDVWVVTMSLTKSHHEGQSLSWKRIATGLFQPLGLKIVDNLIFVTCRDQLARLHDLNGDGEIDYYECFNNDHQVTEHFHEFAMGLQRDGQGNFYYAKSARHALKALVPHHGTLLKVSPDGESTQIVANGFRAANGVCLNPDGSFYVTDQEGFWLPKNRINWVRPGENGKPRFYGNLWGYVSVTDTSDAAMEQPLCWITNEFDRSPGELLWVNSKKWGALNGSLLNLSYGMGRVFLVLPETVGDTAQGGMLALPIPDFPTGVMRGRFHPHDGQLYSCGMFAWAGNAQQAGGLYRIRATGKEIGLPIQMRSLKSGFELTFSSPLNPASVRQDRIQIKTWSLKRTANYGSEHYNEKSMVVDGLSVSEDGLTVQVGLPDIQPTWCMEINFQFESTDGQPAAGRIHNTIHLLPER